MKKLYNYIALGSLALMTGMFIATPAHAFLIDELLKSPSVEMPTFNVPHTVVTTGVALSETATAGAQVVSQGQATMNNALAAANSAMDFNFTALMDGTAMPGQLEYANCSAGDIRVDTLSAESVEEAVQQLFFRYPGGTSAERKKYDDHRKDFYKDSLIEAYVASRQLQLYMNDSVVPTLEKSKKCILGEAKDCGIPSPTDSNAGNNEVLFNEAKALESIDNLLDVLQKAIAIKAQSRAIKAISAIPPAPYDPDDEKYEDNDTDADKIAASASVQGSTALAFAAMGSSNALTAIEDAAYNKDEPVSRVLNSALAFSDAAESDQFHPYETVEESMSQLSLLEPVEEDTTSATEAHNMVYNLESYKQVAVEYKRIQEEHKKALEALRKSNQCALDYLGRRYRNPDVAWAGKALGSNIADYTDRKGISGWAVTAYDTAKAAKTSAVSTDDIPQPNIALDSKKYDDYSKPQENFNQFQQDNPNLSVGASKEEQTMAENRAAVMLPWQLGAEASKVIAQDPSKWGSLQNSFPVWNDTKSFYNQYLDGKYTNVKTYLKGFSVSDVQALVISELRGIKKDATDTTKQKTAAMVAQKMTSAKLGILGEQTAAIATHDKQVAAATTGLERQRENLVTQIDVAAAEAKKLSDELSDRRQQASDKAINDVAKSVTEYDSFGNYSATEEMGAIDNTVVAKTAENQQVVNLPSIEGQLQSQSSKVAALQKQLAQLDEQIKQQKLAAQQKISSIQGSAADKLSATDQQGEAALAKAEEEFSTAATANIDSVAGGIASKLADAYALANPGKEYSGPTSFSLSGALNAVIARALGDLYEKVDQRIDQARKQLSTMGDDLYAPENHDKVVKIHQQMLADIKAMPLTINHNAMGIASTIYLYAKLIPADDEPETEAFFVGAPAKERDLKAPKQVLAFDLPPLREAVHFDEVDFENVKPYDARREKSEPISPADFLNYGGEIPAIWKLMLEGHAFVETDFNLKKALNTGCSAVAFFRGGYMPCQVTGSSTVVDVDASGRYIRGQAVGKLPECPYLEMKSGQVYNSLQEINIQFATSDEIPAADCAYSELGTLLDADDKNTLSFRQSTYEAFHNMLKQQHQLETKTEVSDGMKQKLAAYSAAPLANNQIGDYLKYVEKEQQFRKNAEELKASYEEVLKNLDELFQKFGLETAMGFDLTKESDYNLARSRLEKIKNSKISEAQRQLDAIKGNADDEVLNERVDKYRKIIAALYKDMDEQTMITAVVVDNNNLDAELKTAKVDAEVSKRYEKNLDDNFANKLNLPAAPYCAVY